ncbi:hypothetical protein FRC03_011890 [Tulasnella sp. 419]|nr:hypothetical protein FRC03_011890 [Tulasnella sp. 419]
MSRYALSGFFQRRAEPSAVGIAIVANGFRLKTTLVGIFNQVKTEVASRSKLMGRVPFTNDNIGHVVDHTSDADGNESIKILEEVSKGKVFAGRVCQQSHSAAITNREANYLEHQMNYPQSKSFSTPLTEHVMIASQQHCMLFDALDYFGINEFSATIAGELMRLS